MDEISAYGKAFYEALIKSDFLGCAAIMEKKVDVKGKRLGIIISGGNVDLERLPWVVK